MTRKKAPRQPSPSSQEFSHSPFKSLKGLSASKSTPSPDVACGKERTPDMVTDPGHGHQYSFADEMESLGVKPLPGRDFNADEPGQRVPAENTSKPLLSRAERDKAAFLEAVGSMETAFGDEWTAETSSTMQSAPRRMKQVKRGQLKPEAELDLHGMTNVEAMAKVRFFLQNATHHDFRTLLIITGKGLHSKGQPVLREAVVKLLAETGDLVLEWGAAPRRYGGEGALIVFLRRPATE